MGSQTEDMDTQEAEEEFFDKSFPYGAGQRADEVRCQGHKGS